jgi:hypothetical protein
VDNEQISAISTQVEALHTRLDGLHSKIGQVAEAASHLPDLDSLEERAHDCQIWAETLKQIVEIWNSDGMPTLDEIQDLAKEAGQLASALDRE